MNKATHEILLNFGGEFQKVKILRKKKAKDNHRSLITYNFTTRKARDDLSTSIES